MSFEKWLNKADEEISKRKKKDLNKEKKISEKYDNRINSLYEHYQTNKNSKQMLWVTLILVFITLIYVVYTGSIAKTTRNQFEFENRPYISIENLTVECGYNNTFCSNGGGYKLTLTNKGHTPTKITSIELRSFPTLDAQSEKREKNIWVFQDETFTVDWTKNFNLPPFEYSENQAMFVRAIIKYEWDKKDYYTVADFIFMDFGPDRPSPRNMTYGSRFIYEKEGQIILENPSIHKLYTINRIEDFS